MTFACEKILAPNVPSFKKQSMRLPMPRAFPIFLTVKRSHSLSWLRNSAGHLSSNPGYSKKQQNLTLKLHDALPKRWMEPFFCHVIKTERGRSILHDFVHIVIFSCMTMKKPWLLICAWQRIREISTACIARMRLHSFAQSLFCAKAWLSSRAVWSQCKGKTSHIALHTALPGCTHYKKAPLERLKSLEACLATNDAIRGFTRSGASSFTRQSSQETGWDLGWWKRRANIERFRIKPEGNDQHWEVWQSLLLLWSLHMLFQA